MTAERLTIVLSADGKNLVGTLKTAEGAVKKFGTAVDKAGDKAKKADQKTKGFSSTVGRLSKRMLGLSAVLGGFTLVRITQEIIAAGNAAIGFNNATLAITGSQQLAKKELEFVRGVAEELGVTYQGLVPSYTKLLAASQGTNIEGAKTRQIFEDIVQAGRVLNLSQADIAGSLRAVEQIMSKGTVQAEELRGQLGDRIPGAFRIMAESIGVTQVELNSMLDKGEVLAEEVLPAFAARLGEISEAGKEAAANSPAASFARLSTALFELKAAIADNGFLEFMADLADIATRAANALTQVTEASSALSTINERLEPGPNGYFRDPISGLRMDEIVHLSVEELKELAAAQPPLTALEEKFNEVSGAAQGLFENVRAVADGAIAFYNRRISEGQDATDAYVKTSDKLLENARQQVLAFGKSSSEVAKLNGEIALAAATTEEQRAAIQATTVALVAKLRELEKLEAAQDAQIEKTRLAEKAERDLAKAVKAGNKALQDAARQRQSVAEALEELVQATSGLSDEDLQLARAERVLEAAIVEKMITVTQARAIMEEYAATLDTTCGEAEEASKCVDAFTASIEQLNEFTFDAIGNAFGNFFADMELNFDALFDDLVNIARQRSSELFQTAFKDILENGITLGRDGNLAQLGAAIAPQVFGGGPGAQVGGAIGGLVGGPIGNIVGSAIGGALDSIFDDSNPPRVRVVNTLSDADPSGIRAQSPFTDQFGNPIFAAGREVTEEQGREATQAVLDLAVALDSAIFAFLDTSQRLAVGQELVPGGNQETSTLFQGEFTEQEVLEARFQQIMGAFSQTIQDTVNEFGTDIESSVQALKDVLNIESLIEAGQGGAIGALGLDQALNLLVDLNEFGETLGQTYIRVSVAANNYQFALDVLGVTTEREGEAFLRFATNITEAAGGFDRAGQLWEAFLSDTFFSPEELLAQQASLARARATSELSDVGLAGDTSAEEFRRLFTEILPTLSAEATVQWLEAAEALGVVIDLESQLEAARGQGALSADELLAREADLARMRTSVAADIERLTLSPFQADVAALTRAYDAQRAEAVALGATTEDLSLLSRRYRLELGALVDQLRADTGDLVEELYGSPLSQVQDQIDAITQRTIAGNDAVVRSTEQRVSAEISAMQRLEDFVNSLLLDSNLSALSPDQQFNEAQRIFEETLAAASTDIDAFNRLPQAARGFLDIARERFASSEAYKDIFNAIVASLSGIEAPLGSDPLGAGSISSGGGQVNVSSPELEVLLAERDRLLAEQEAQHRLDLALRLAENLRDLSAAVNEPLIALAEQLGVSLSDLVADLGVDISDMTVDTTLQLASVANSLGAELQELAESIGLDLGSLVDDQSLLNDALESVIATLPVGIQDELGPLLQAVESATTEADANAALADLETATAALPAEFTDLMAPFFDSIDPSNGDAVLDRIRELESDQLEVLREIRDAVKESSESNDVVAKALDPSAGTIGVSPFNNGSDPRLIERELQRQTSAVEDLAATVRESNARSATLVRS